MTITFGETNKARQVSILQHRKKNISLQNLAGFIIRLQASVHVSLHGYDLGLRI